MINVEKMMDFEADELNAEDTLEFFAELIHTGAAWELQGIYGLTAKGYITAGLITPMGEVTAYGYEMLDRVDD